MNHTLIIQRAFTLGKRYRVLWLLGILLALTAGGGGAGCNANATFGSDGSGGPFPGLEPGAAAALMAALALVACVVVLLLLVAMVVRYVVQAGLIASVDQIEETAHAPSFGQGFKLGWNWRALRLFLIDVVITVPVALIGIAVLLAAFSPLLLLLIDNAPVRIFSVVLTVGTVFFVLLVGIVVIALVNLCRQFMMRAVVLDDLGVFAAIRAGFLIARRHARDVAVMWLLMFGIALAYGLVMIPVFIALVLLGALLGGLPAWVLFQLTESYLLAGLVGAPIFLAVLIIPLLIISGFYEAFRSSVWTLTYRECKALEA